MTTAADRPICEAADDVFLPTSDERGPCSDQCPKHGRSPRSVAEAFAQGWWMAPGQLDA